MPDSILNTPRRPLLRRIFRAGFPQIVIVATVAIYFATMIGLGHQIERQWVHMSRTALVGLALVLLAIWTIFRSGWRKLPTAIAVLLMAGGAVASFHIENDGDLNPSIHARYWVLHLFDAAHEDNVAAERKRQAVSLPARPIDLSPTPIDWPAFRGPNRNGVADRPCFLRPGTPIARDWNAHPPRELWKQGIYKGYSSFAIVNGFLFTMEQRKENEAVVCYDAENSREMWVHEWPGDFFEAMGGEGPRATPTVYEGDVYALGALGRLVCLDGKTGDLKWEVETLKGSKNLQWAMSGSPLVYGDYVVVNPGAGEANPQNAGQTVVAYDRHTGKVLRQAGKAKAGYSSPMLAKLSGRLQVLLFDGEGLAGYDPESLTELWRYRWPTQDGINVAQPVVLETETSIAAAGAASGSTVNSHKGEVFIASSYGRGGALLKVEEKDGVWSAAELWNTDRRAMRCKFTSPVMHDGYLFGFDDGDLQCIDLQDGHVMWTDKRLPGENAGYGQGQLLLSGDILVILTQYGEVALVEANPKQLTELARKKVLRGDKTWNNPAMSGGRLYVRNHLEMAALDLR